LCVRGRDAVDAPGRCRVAPGNGAEELSEDEAKGPRGSPGRRRFADRARVRVVLCRSPFQLRRPRKPERWGTDPGMDMGTD